MAQTTPETAPDTEAPARPRRSIWRRIGRVLLVLFGLLVLVIAVGVAVAWQAMGSGPDPARAERMARSPHSKDGIFVNSQPLWNDVSGWFGNMTSASDYIVPEAPLPVHGDTAARLATPPGRLRVTWLGHSTTLIELGGKRVLTDPIFGDSPFPIPALGPQRWYASPLPLDALKGVDAVLISHDHYDHLDHPTIVAMRGWDTTFVTALGVGAHLEYWGIDPARIVELDWWQEHTIDDLRIVATPARHASGRQLFDQNRTQWAGYALVAPDARVMFSGDTGLFDEMKTIGERYGPFDVVMIEVGAYHATWPDWHIGPEQAIVGHRMLRGELFMPIHWGLFNLALHGWTEPMERTWAAAEKAGVRFVAPRPGAVIDVDAPPAPERWWPDVPWQTAAEAPVISTRDGDPDNRYPAP